jgi:hypothetical protein
MCTVKSHLIFVCCFSKRSQLSPSSSTLQETLEPVANVTKLLFVPNYLNNANKPLKGHLHFQKNRAKSHVFNVLALATLNDATIEM